MRNHQVVYRLLLGGLAISCFLPGPSPAPERQAAAARPSRIASPAPVRLDTAFGKLPLQFIPNEGQKNKAVAYYVEGRDKTICFTPEGLTIVLARDPGDEGKIAPARSAAPASRWVVKLDFVGAKKGIVPAGLEKSGTVVSYFRGKPEDWKTGLAACSKLVYRDLWPGIDLIYSGTFNRMKYEFVVHPGADPSKVRLAYRGAEKVALTADGRVAVQTPAGGFEDDAPIAYQETEGVRRSVPVSYDLDSGTYGFAVGEYDRARTLVIDPSSFIYCGFVGGAGEEKGQAIAVDGEGCAYIAGYTSMSGSTLPVIVGPDLTPNGDYSDCDAFVAKINASGTALVYCGFIGGSEYDFGLGIAVDGWGNAYVTGSTRSSESGFPVTVGPDLTLNGDRYGDDAFVAKVTASGTALAYCGYIGGSSYDLGYGIAVDLSGSAYVTGRTDSGESTFPVLVGPDLTYNGNSEAFVAKVNPSGADLAYCGYIGSSGGDVGHGIAVDAAGCAYVAGGTSRREDELGLPVPPFFPEIVGPDLTYNGGSEAFVAKVDSTGSSLVYSGYIGGLSGESCSAIAVDGAGNAYVTGSTKSDQTTFPVKGGPDLTFNGESDGFVAEVEASGASLIYCGYIGGSGDDYPYAIAIAAAGNAYVTGETWSDEATFPTVNGPDRNRNGLVPIDAFVAKVEPSGAALAYSGFLGGGGSDYGYGIAVDAAGCAYVTGSTGSADLAVTVGPDLTYNYNGTSDAFVIKIPANPVIYKPVITSLTPPSVLPNQPAFTLVVRGTDFSEGAGLDIGYTGFGTTFINETELQAEIYNYYFGSGSVVPIRVHNPGGEVSNDFMFYINNPVPVLDSLEPAYLTGGSPDTAIFMKGSNFVENSEARWNGQPIYSGISWTGEGWATVPESLLAQAGNATVTVFNPPPEGGTSNAWTIPVTGFTLGPSSQSVTVNRGQQAVYTIQVTPQLGPFDGRIDFSSSGLPRGCTKSFYPMGLTPGADPGTTVLTLTTTAGSGGAAGTLAPSAPFGRFPEGLLFLLPALWPWLFVRKIVVPPPARRWLLSGAAVCLMVLVSSCGAGGPDNPPPGTGTPKGTYNIQVDAKSGTMTVSTTLKLVVR